MTTRRIALFIAAALITAAWVLLADANRRNIDTLVEPTASATIESERIDAPATVKAPPPTHVMPREEPRETSVAITQHRSHSLRVIDELTRRPILEGTILRSLEWADDEWFEERGREPDEDEFTEVLLAGTFPDTLDVEIEDRILWFTAHGYGWQQVVVEGDFLHVELASQCLLSVNAPVSYPRCSEGDGGKLWVWRAVGEHYELIGSSRRPDKHRLFFGDVVPGDYRIVLEQHGRVRGGLVVAEEVITIAPGDAEHVVTLIPIEEANEPGRITVSIETTGNIDGAQDVMKQRLTLKGPTTKTRALGGTLTDVPWTRSGDTFTTTVQCLAPGRYTVVLEPSGLTQNVEVISETSALAHFDMRRLATIEISFEECPGDWRSELLWGTETDRLAHQVSIDDPPSGLVLRTNAEPTWLTLVGLNRVPTSLLVTPTPEAVTTVTFECAPGSTHAASLTVTDLEAPSTIYGYLGAEALGVRPSLLRGSLEVKPIGHAGELLATNFHSFRKATQTCDISIALYFNSPGRYAVTFLHPDGTLRTTDVLAPGPPVTISYAP